MMNHARKARRRLFLKADGPRGRVWQRLIVADFYLAALLLLIAGVAKAMRPGVSELLENLLEQGLLSLPLTLFVARWQAGFEIIFAMVALSGWRFQWCARGLAVLYLLFAVLIALAADGYWFAPIDCGCFATGAQTPAYLLLLRNILIAFPLLFARFGSGNSLFPGSGVSRLLD